MSDNVIPFRPKPKAVEDRVGPKPGARLEQLYQDIRMYAIHTDDMIMSQLEDFFEGEFRSDVAMVPMRLAMMKAIEAMIYEFRGLKHPDKHIFDQTQYLEFVDYVNACKTE